MAAYSQSRGVIGVGKRFLNQIGAGGSLSPPLLATSRAVHVSVYEKNPDDQIRGTVVPDEVIGSQPEKYWGPHPQTGVFGPSAEHKPTAGLHTSAAEDSILEQKAFFRPLEDLDKPSEDSEKPFRL